MRTVSPILLFLHLVNALSSQKKSNKSPMHSKSKHLRKGSCKLKMRFKDQRKTNKVTKRATLPRRRNGRLHLTPLRNRNHRSHIAHTLITLNQMLKVRKLKNAT